MTDKVSYVEIRNQARETNIAFLGKSLIRVPDRALRHRNFAR